MRTETEVQDTYETMIKDANCLLEKVSSHDRHLGKAIRPRIEVIVDKMRKRSEHIISDIKKDRRVS